MLKKYKNGFIDIIRKHGLDVASFRVGDISLPYASHFVLSFLGKGLEFDVVGDPRESLHLFKFRCTTFETNFPWRKPKGISKVPPCRIDKIYEAFDQWLRDEVKPYIEEMTLPDPWTQIEQQRQLITATSLTPHEVSPFTEEEKPSLYTSIKQFRLLICENFKPAQEQLEIIDERLDYLSKAVDRLNRFDWKSVALNTVLTIAVALSCDTDKGRLLLNLFKQAFAGVLHLLQ
jgi:hypothetical protein